MLRPSHHRRNELLVLKETTRDLPSAAVHLYADKTMCDYDTYTTVPKTVSMTELMPRSVLVNLDTSVTTGVSIIVVWHCYTV